MTLVLYLDKYRDRLLKHIQLGEEHIMLNIDYVPTPEGVLRFEDLITNTELLLVDKYLTEFGRTWFKDVKEFIYLEYRIKQYFAVAAKVLAVLLRCKPDRIVFVTQDHTIRSVIKSYCAYYGARYTAIPSGDPKRFVVPVPARTELSQGQSELNEQICQGFLRNGKSNVLWYLSIQSALELEAVEQSNEVQPIVFNGTNDVAPEVLGHFPLEMIPGSPSQESMNYPLELFDKLLKDFDWVENLRLMGVIMNEDFIWSLREAAALGMAIDKDARDWFNKLHKKWDFKAVVVTQDSFGLERSVVMEARKLGIPSIVIAHGWYGDWYPDIPKIIADYATSWGSRMKANLEKLVSPGSQVVDVGAMRLQVFKYFMDKVDIGAKKKELGIPLDKPVVLLVANAYVEFYAHSSSYEMNEMLKRVLKDFAGRYDLALLVRLHPYTQVFENPDIKNSVIEKYTRKHPNIVKDPRWHPWEAVALADVVVTHESTLGIESLYCGKKVIGLSVPGKINSFRYDGAVVDIPPDLYSQEPIDIYEACKRALSNAAEFQHAEKAAKEFLKQVVSDETGVGIRQLIEGVCNGKTQA